MSGADSSVIKLKQEENDSATRRDKSKIVLKGLFLLSCNILLLEAVPCDSLLLLCSCSFLVVVQWGEKLWGKHSVSNGLLQTARMITSANTNLFLLCLRTGAV
ncbi:unnamed protein product [Musa acuminata subsp. malaccensis]|uniref:(wild Malaysian banana) hypothetical protein n=1 Tax=Musa acuminata subsp. malaccensis TaxID=214687 RepID=A0A804L2B5_MUSAM|nr:unnamed protein product [Musa acuminata subsp. malaccensis]